MIEKAAEQEAEDKKQRLYSRMQLHAPMPGPNKVNDVVETQAKTRGAGRIDRPVTSVANSSLGRAAGGKYQPSGEKVKVEQVGQPLGRPPPPPPDRPPGGRGPRRLPFIASLQLSQGGSDPDPASQFPGAVSLSAT